MDKALDDYMINRGKDDKLFENMECGIAESQLVVVERELQADGQVESLYFEY